ncbi:MAG TPA: glycosyltransferase family 4 protein [Spirochaetota bacterium]|nr:glycosyltransferase family 4 protein [Spirochaetota bacterium]HPG49076.1 glycosyltransferase family 4 protein [Spirochaetota bacterium]HPN11486.1 glycosyltransferase family 4 protein [Spirochaetota bacterium]HQL83053.1 glycosyltransferase family 4 protein [Spirochaetota bacterium]
MKVCLLSYRGNPYCGGQGIYVMYIARELVKLGHEVHVIAGPPYPFEEEGVTIHCISNHNYFNKPKDFIKPHKPFATFQPLNFYEFIAAKLGIFPEIETFSFRAFLKLKELLKTHKFDIIHDNQCLGYGFLLIQRLGIPFISTIHHPLSIDRSTWFEYPSDFNIKMRRILYYPLLMQSFVANRMSRIITVSHNAALEINKAFGVNQKNISVIYNGMDSSLFYPVKGVKKKSNSIIFVGNVEDRKKGIIYLLKAMTLTKHNVTLTIVDGGAPNRSTVPHLIDKLGVNGRVTFTGKIPIEKLITLYSQHEMAVLPSLYEGFGFPAAEAMACELPVITSTAGALPEVVGEHMETGYLVPPRDAHAIAEGIDFLLDNPEIRKRLGKAGRKRVLEIFTWENAARELVNMYEEVINAHR